MNEAELVELERYVRWVADEIELRDWTITITREPCADHYNAKVDCVDGRKHATVEFNRDFRSVDAEDQRQTIVHELVHAHHAVCWRMVQTDLLRPLGQETYGVFCDSYRRSMEYAVDAIADALAKHMPLIEWPTGD